MSARMIRLVVASYVVKTLLFTVAWLLVPDLPRRAMNSARGVWLAVAGSAEP